MHPLPPAQKKQKLKLGLNMLWRFIFEDNKQLGPYYESTSWEVLIFGSGSDFPANTWLDYFFSTFHVGHVSSRNTRKG